MLEGIRRAVLRRAIPVLGELPPAGLEGARVLMLADARDPFGKHAPALTHWFSTSGAAQERRSVDAGHYIVAEDEALARQWLMQESADADG